MNPSRVFKWSGGVVLGLVLFVGVVIALAWVVLVGEFVSSLKRLKLKNNGSPERSVFRAGLDCLRQILLSGRSGKLVLDDLIPLLSSS